MIRWIYRTIIAGLLIGILWVGTARGLSYWVAQRLPEWVATLSMPEARLSVRSIDSGMCWTQACVSVGEARLDIVGVEPLIIRDIRLESPLRWPWRAHIMTADNQPMVIDAVVGQNRIEITRCEGTVGGLNFAVTGSLDWLTKEGRLQIQTVGLKRFIHRIVQVPKWLDFLLSDGIQTIDLVPQDGFLRFWGVPLIPLK